MAKKTNKTDHVLNLLSSGKKTNTREENDAPPVDLRRRAPESPEEEDLPEPKVSEDFDDQQLPEPKMTRRIEEDLPEPRVSMTVEEESLPEPRRSAAPAEPPLPEPRIAAEPEKAPETKVTAEMAPKAPAVSVVHTANEENHIADAVRDSLEAEFNEYLREKGEIPAEPETERLIEWETPKVKEPTEINVFELMRESEEEAVQAEQEVGSEAEPVESGEEPEQAPMQEKPVAEPDAEPESTGEPNQAADTAIEQGEDVLPEAVTEPAAEPAAESVMPEEEPMEEKDYTMVNVMEYLVRDQAPRYIRQFGHCDCDRCIEDTVALTLTHLPAKYVVVNKNAVSPLLNFYEKKYAGQLIVEITKATMIVNESPNH